MAIRTEKLVVTRGDMAKAFDRAFERFAKATEEEIDARVKSAFESHRRARHRTPREWWTDCLVRLRS